MNAPCDGWCGPVGEASEAAHELFTPGAVWEKALVVERVPMAGTCP